MRYRHSQSRLTRPGVAMMLVLVAVAVSLILGLAFLSAQSTSASIAQNINHHAQARAIAEAAVSLAMAKIRANTTWRSEHPNGYWVSNGSISGGTFSLRVEDGVDSDGDGVAEGDGDLADAPTDPVIITAVGFFDGASHEVQVTATFQPSQSKRMMMVVPNASSLRSEDQFRKTLFEGWGWAVTLVAQNSSQQALDSLASINNVVYVVENVSVSSVGSKLRDLPIGLVSEEGALNVELGFSSQDAGTALANWTNVVNNTHYITSSLGTGNLPLCSFLQPLRYLRGTLASGATVLTRSGLGNFPQLIVVERGGALRSGAAPARRVSLPWAGSHFNPNTLSAGAKTILERSLDWASSAAAVASVNAGVATIEDIDLNDESRIDSFDSQVGPYGGANVGSQASVSTNSTGSSKIEVRDHSVVAGSVKVGPGGSASAIKCTGHATITGAKGVLDVAAAIPAAAEPDGMPESSGDLVTTQTLTADRHVRRLILSGADVLDVSGDVNLLCDEAVDIGSAARIRVAAGSTLRLYFRGSFTVRSGGQINIDAAKPDQVLIYNLGNSNMTLTNSARVYACINNPMSELRLDSSAQLYGRYAGRTLSLSDDSAVHQDTSATGGSPRGGSGPTVYTASFAWEEQP